MLPQEYLFTHHHEALPEWLAGFQPDHLPAASSIMQDFLDSRLVFYPGSGFDGSVVKLFNEAQAAHCFVYVDYGITRDAIEHQLDGNKTSFRGYRSLARLQVREADFGIGRWEPHVQQEAVRYWFPTVVPFAFLEVLEKAPGAVVPGANRIAVLFLAADGHATYDALFCQKSSPSLFCAVLQDYGFGGNHSPFGAGGMMNEAALSVRRFPKLLLVGDNTREWEGYDRVPGVDALVVDRFRSRSLYAQGPDMEEEQFMRERVERRRSMGTGYRTNSR